MSTSLRGSLPFLLAAGLLAGCNGGGDDTGTIDTGDTGVIDTGPVDTGEAAGLLLAEVSDDGQPFPGARVVFHDADGTVLGTETVDRYGLASWPDFPAGGTVTAAIDEGDSRTLLTATDLDPEDGFVVLDPSGFGDRESVPVTLELPGEHPDATTYAVRACGRFGSQSVIDPTSSESFEFASWCRSADGTLQVMAQAMDGGDPVAWSLAEDLRAEDTGTFSSWSTSWTTVDVTVENLPADLDGDPEVALFGSVEGVDVFHETYEGCSVSSSEVECTGLEIPADLDNLGVRVGASYDVSDATSPLQVYEHHDTVPSTVTVDLADRALPPMDDPALDPGSRELGWTVDGQASGVDLAIGLVSYEIGGTSYVWIVQAPTDGSAPIVLPELPPVLSTWWTEDQAAFPDPPGVLLVEDSRYDYPDLRVEVLSSTVSRRFSGIGSFDGRIGAVTGP